MINGNKNFRKEFNAYMKGVKPSEKLIDDTVLLLEEEQSKMYLEKGKSKRNRVLALLCSTAFREYVPFACTILFSLFAVKLYNNMSTGAVPIRNVIDEPSALTSSATYDSNVKLYNETSYLDGDCISITNSGNSKMYTYVDTLTCLTEGVETSTVTSTVVNGYTTATTGKGTVISNLYGKSYYTNTDTSEYSEETYATQPNTEYGTEDTMATTTDYVGIVTSIPPVTTQKLPVEPALTDSTYGTNATMTTTDTAINTTSIDNCSEDGTLIEGVTTTAYYEDSDEVVVGSPITITTIPIESSTTINVDSNNDVTDDDGAGGEGSSSTYSLQTQNSSDSWFYEYCLKDVTYTPLQPSSDDTSVSKNSCVAVRVILKKSICGYYYNSINYSRLLSDLPLANYIPSRNCIVTLSKNETYCDAIILYDNVDMELIQSSIGDFANLFSNDYDTELIVPLICESFETIDVNGDGNIGYTEDVETLLKTLTIDDVPFNDSYISNILDNVSYID